MSFPDPPPPPPPPPLPFMLPLPFPGGNLDGFWPQYPMNNAYPDSNFQFELAPPFKRSRNAENNPPNSAPLPPMNPRMNPSNPPTNKGISNIFFKTRMCAKFLEGICRNGENCSFAHGHDDMRQPPHNWQAIIREKDRGLGNWNDDQRIIHRMKICKKFYNGEECPYGENCNFLHETPSKFKTDMATPGESSAISIGTVGPIMEHRSGIDLPDLNKHLYATSDNSQANMKPAYWKTKFCSRWEATGQCPFGERCHFAHGQSDLQVPGAHIEAEAMTNIVSIPTKPLSVSVNDVSPTNPVVDAPKKEGEGKKGLLKWKGQKKINRIYADWIDDLMPPHRLPSQVES